MKKPMIEKLIENISIGDRIFLNGALEPVKEINPYNEKKLNIVFNGDREYEFFVFNKDLTVLVIQ